MVWFLIWTLFFWSLTENLFTDLVAFVIDILMQTQDGSFNDTLFIIWIMQIIFSGIFLLFKFALILYIIIWWWKNEKYKFLFDGVKNHWAFFYIYFGHYLIIWIVLALMVAIVDYPKVIIIALLVVQMISFGVHFIKMYTDFVTYFQVLIVWEFSLLLDSIFIIYVVYSGNTSVALGYAIMTKNFLFAFGLFI